MKRIAMAMPVFCALAALILSGAADAAIRCDGNFQITKGDGRISTPYCADGYLAKVAQEYGMRVSAGAIRQNPFVKARACRFVGDDIRVRDTCAGYRNEGPRGRF